MSGRTRSQSIVVLFLLVCSVSSLAATSEHPNILWVVSEDNNCFLGCYGDKLAHTPTLDRLAREGVLYERCFAWPVCAPSRFTLITGTYPVSSGPAEHMRAKGNIPPWMVGFPELLRKAGYYTANNSKTDYNSPIKIKATWDESDGRATWEKRSDPKQPFFSVFNYMTTHESCLFPETEQKLDFPATDPAVVRIPPYQPDTPEIRADWARYYNHMTLVDEQIAARLKALEKDGLADDTIVFYYGDNGGVLPRSKRFLEWSGMQVPLIVYFPPKWRHLAPAPPGSRISEPVSFLDFAPTMLSLAGVNIPGYMEGRALFGPARGKSNEFVYITRDRMDERYDMMRVVSDGHYLYVHNFRPDLPYVQPLDYQFKARGYQSWARVAAEGKLTPATAQFWGTKQTEELYDLATDPDNVSNLVAQAEFRPKLERMRAELKRRAIASFDNGFIPEGSPLEGYENSRKPGAYPVESVFDIAILASQRNPTHLPKLIEALSDPSEPIRWWGAQGCAMLGRQAAAAEAPLTARLEDSSIPVQVAAAESLARLGKLDRALPTLERCLTNSQQFFALQAANVVDRLGEDARPSLPRLKEARRSLDENDPASNTGPFYVRAVLTHAIAVLEHRQAALVYPAFERQ